MKQEVIRDIIQWDVKSWSKALEFWDEKIDWKNVQNGLELGGREGGLSLWLALKGKSVVCSDLMNVQSTAESLHRKYGVQDQITYQDIDATHIPYTNHFDVIMFKSIIGGIGRDGKPELQKKTFDEIYKALKPGGKLLFAENLSASPFHRILRKKFVRWGSSWRYVSPHEIRNYLKNFSSMEIRTTGFLSATGRSENQRNIFSAFDSLIFNHIFPESWKYIVYGIATK